MNIFLFHKIFRNLLTRRAASESTGNSHSFYHPVPGKGTTNPENGFSVAECYSHVMEYAFEGNVARRFY